MSSILSEKEDLVSRLGERIETLEQRLQDGELTGDDRVTALETEVNVYYYYCVLIAKG